MRRSQVVRVRGLGIIAALVVLPPTGLRGQWLIGAEFGIARYGGTARDTSSGGGPTVRPGDATALGLRVSRRWGSTSVAFRATYGTPGVAATGQGFSVTDRTAGNLIELTALLGVQVAGVGPSGAVRVELGPALHLFKAGDEIRSRVGAVGAAAYEWPVAGRFSGALRLEGAISQSWFDENDLPPEYERRLTWRYGMTVGLRYRL